VTLTLLDRSITLPAGCAAAIKVILDGHAVTPAELPALDDEDRLVLARRLVREGVLVAV
jgi:hypothetical protein